jgi:hypothetical protein
MILELVMFFLNYVSLSLIDFYFLFCVCLLQASSSVGVYFYLPKIYFLPLLEITRVFGDNREVCVCVCVCDSP